MYIKNLNYTVSLKEKWCFDLKLLIYCKWVALKLIHLVSVINSGYKRAQAEDQVPPGQVLSGGGASTTRPHGPLRHLHITLKEDRNFVLHTPKCNLCFRLLLFLPLWVNRNQWLSDLWTIQTCANSSVLRKGILKAKQDKNIATNLLSSSFPKIILIPPKKDTCIAHFPTDYWKHPSLPHRAVCTNHWTTFTGGNGNATKEATSSKSSLRWFLQLIF